MEDELATLYETCIFRDRNDREISYEVENKLSSLMDKIQSNIPDLPLDCHEQNHVAEREFER